MVTVSIFLCPKSAKSLRWVPSPAKPSALGINSFISAPICAHNRQNHSDGYRLQQNLLRWELIVVANATLLVHVTYLLVHAGDLTYEFMR